MYKITFKNPDDQVIGSLSINDAEIIANFAAAFGTLPESMGDYTAEVTQTIPPVVTVYKFSDL